MVIQYTAEHQQNYIDLCKQMHQESVKFSQMSLNADKLIDIAENHYCGLYFKDNKPVGFLIGYACPAFFSDDMCGYELALFISPEYRGGMGAVRLIKHFENWCKDKGCVEVNAGSSVQVATDTVKKLYNKLGYTERGFVAYKDL